MASTFKNMWNNIKKKNTVSIFIIINIAVFLILAVLKVFVKLFGVEFLDLNAYIAVSSNATYVVKHIWTLFTYMFVHYDVLHILFNMLMLYWFGQIFSLYFTSKHLVAVYILGGIAGAVFYILSFNTVPYFINLGNSEMVGASASVTAIIFAAAFYNKNMEVRLLFIGQIKIIYIALFIFILDFIALGGDSNQGGHVAHIGGAILGYFFASKYLKGKDITKWFNKIIDICVNIFTKKPKMRVKYKKAESDSDYNQRKHNETEEIDLILDKIKQSGYKSLSEKEKKRLFDASNK